MAELACPFCNALFEPEIVGRSVLGKTCPRCGEILPTTMQERLAGLPGRPEDSSEPATGMSNRTIGLGILALMLVMAVIGLAFALWTQDFRRRNDFKVQQASPQELRPPIEWAALGYVPDKCDVLAGLHVADFLSGETKDGPKLFDPPRPDGVNQVIGQVEKWTGQRLTNFHHLVLALDVTEIFPQVTIVARTHQPYNVDELAHSAKATKTSDLHGKPLFAFVDGKIGAGRIWCPDQQTVVLVWRVDGAFGEKVLAKLPYPPRPGREAVSETLRDVMTSERLGKTSALWVVGAGEWAAPLALLNAAPIAGIKVPGWLTEVKTFSFGVAMEPSPVLVGHVQASNDKYAREIKSMLESKIPEVKVALSPADAKGPDANWLTLQRKFDVAEVRAMMQGK